ncbi:MAG: DUF4038 domain-containing protein [Chloroflexi bacterium]|nr:DUF4038 domain-containing protein [Chloroflexota bacterium]
MAAYLPGEYQWSFSGTQLKGSFAVPERSTDSRWPASVLQISQNRRHLEYADRTPFFFLGDTAWFILWKGTPDQWAKYLDYRVEQGFNVILTQLLPYFLDLRDRQGQLAFIDNDVNRPNDLYFSRVDQFCMMAAERGLFVMLSLIWGYKPREQAAQFSTAQACDFTRYAVARYAAYPVLWSLSGDAPYLQDLAKWEAVGAKLEAVDPYAHPTTNHLFTSLGWRFLFHDSHWHDFHMLQTTHVRRSVADIGDLPLAYYKQQPVKAVINGEPWYEGHPARDEEEFGPVFTAEEQRFAFWTSILSGTTMGHTYGGQGIWNWKIEPPHDVAWKPHIAFGPTWKEALSLPGAEQCAIGAKYLQTVNWWDLTPRPEQIQLEPVPPLAAQRPSLAVAPERTWIAYLPRSDARVTLKGLTTSPWSASWIDPINGKPCEIGLVEPDAFFKWVVPSPPEPRDWLLVLQNDSANLTPA